MNRVTMERKEKYDKNRVIMKVYWRESGNFGKVEK